MADVYPIRVEAVGRDLDWSPDGEYLAVPDKSQAEEPFHIVLIRAKDGARTIVTMPPDKIIGDLSPAFSPDGKSLAFLRAVSSGVEDVYVAPAHGGPPTRLTSDNRNALSVTWTADSRSIVFSSDRRRNSVLWRVRASGGEPERIAGVAENAADPAFSRDGRMAYAQVFHGHQHLAHRDGIEAAARQGDLLDAIRFEPAIFARRQPRGVPVESFGKQRDLGQRQQRTNPGATDEIRRPADGNAALVARRNEYRI